MTQFPTAIGIIIDETVNVTIDKKLMFYLRIVKDEQPTTVFLGNSLFAMALLKVSPPQ